MNIAPLTSDDVAIWMRAPKWVWSEARYYDHLDALAMSGPRSAFTGLSPESVVA